MIILQIIWFKMTLDQALDLVLLLKYLESTHQEVWKILPRK